MCIPPLSIESTADQHGSVCSGLIHPGWWVSNHGEQTAKRSEVRGRKKRKSGEEEAAGRSLIDSSISVLPPSACF